MNNLLPRLLHKFFIPFVLNLVYNCQAKNRKENELTSVKDEMLTMQKRFQELLNQARMETDMKIQECEELRMHVGFQIMVSQCFDFFLSYEYLLYKGNYFFY